MTPITWGIMQEITPGHMVGRVFSLYTTCAMAAAIAQVVAFGWVTQEFGKRTSVVGISLMLFATALMAVVLSRWVQIHQVLPVAADRMRAVHAADA